MGEPAYRVFVAPNGHTFMTEIAEAIAGALQDLGRQAAVAHDLPWGSPDTVNLVVAPHEFFPSLRGYPERVLLESASYCVCLNLEQPGNSWFETSAKYAGQGPFCLDVSSLGVEALRARGLNAERLILGYHRSWDCWHGDEAAERTIDVVFLGTRNPRRDAFFKNHQPTFAAMNCHFVFWDPFEDAASAGYVAGAAKYELLARSKILLNLHRSRAPYFEWNRAVQAIANGCVVVSEPSDDTAPLVPGEHLVEAELDELPAVIEALLRQPARLQRLQQDGYAFLGRETTLAASLRALTSRLAEQAGHFSSGTPPLPGKPGVGMGLLRAPGRARDYARTVGYRRFLVRSLQPWHWAPKLLGARTGSGEDDRAMMP